MMHLKLENACKVPNNIINNNKHWGIRIYLRYKKNPKKIGALKDRYCLDTPQSKIYYVRFCGQEVNATVSCPNVQRSIPPKTLFLSFYFYLFLL